MAVMKSSLTFRIIFGDKKENKLSSNADGQDNLIPDSDWDEETKQRLLSTAKFTGILSPDDPEFQCQMNGSTKELIPEMQSKPKVEIVWINVFITALLHLGALYGLFLILTLRFKFSSFLKGYAYSILLAMGITAGAHRYWAHKSYKATLPLHIFLIILQTLNGQNSIFEWVRDHRVHHKFTETHADPHNARRGFFFAHMGWLLCKKHPDVLSKGKLVDMSDLTSDPYVMWQHRNYPILALIGLLIIPVVFLKYVGNEPWYTAFWAGGVFRYVLSLHFTWLVNSAAHLWGSRPFDRFMNPSENIFVSIVANGEGWHNYHHVFPWDYKTSELGAYKYNLTTAFIDFFAWIGWAYDLKTVNPEIVKKRVMRTGDGSHPVWGWGDKDTPKDHIDQTIRLKQKLL